MRLKLVILTLLAPVLLHAQTANITEGCAPIQINFTPPASATAYYWEFGDGASSQQASPSNTYTTPGVYQVKFKNGVSGALIGTINITIHQKPTLSISTVDEPKGCAPLAVTFNNTTSLPSGVSAQAFNWSFGNGASGSGSPTSTTFASAGVYSITLELITNMASCNTTAIFSNYVSVSTPPATFFTTTPTPAIACDPPFDVTFNNVSSSSLPLTFEWDFGNSNTSNLQSPGTQTYTSDGMYTVVLTATDTNNCSKAFQGTVLINGPTSSFNMVDTVCINAATAMINTSTSGTYSWNFGAGASPATSSSVAPSVTFTTAGLHNVTLTTTSNGCSHDTTMQIYVEDPIVTFTSAPSYSCYEPVLISYDGSSTGNIVSWEWEFGDGATASNEDVTHLYNIRDTMYLELGENILSTTLTVTTTNGCVGTFTKEDTVHLPWARFMPDVAKGCAPLTVTFYDSTKSNEPVVNWFWDFDDASTLSLNNNNPFSHTFTNPGEYDVVLIITNDKGCKDTSYHITIEVGELKAIDFSFAPTSVCPGEPVTITNLTPAGDMADIDAWNYATNQEILSRCYQDDEPTFVFNDSTGFMDITLTAEYNGCYSSITKTNALEVKGPIAHFDFDKDCSTPFDIDFSDLSQDATSVSWDLGDGNGSTSLGFTHVYGVTGDFEVILTASNSGTGCPDDKDTAVIHIRDLQAAFNIDSLLCGDTAYVFDASASQDVHSFCHRGYTWAFSDPTMRPVTTPDPTEPITFMNSGFVTISLIVEDINGCFDTISSDALIHNTSVDFSIADNMICIPDTIAFTDLSVGDTTIVQWQWNFGDGQDTLMQNPSHIYAVSAPSFVVELTTTDALGCRFSNAKTINVYKPVSTITTAPTVLNMCVDAPVSFTGSDYTSQGSNLIFEWNFDDGNTGGGQTVSHGFDTAGVYSVMLTYTEAATGCKDSTFTTVTVQDYPMAGFSSDVDGLQALCDPQIVNFLDTSSSTSGIISQVWNFGSGAPITGPSPSYTFGQGEHNISLVVSTSFGCKDTVFKTLRVIGPSGNFSIDINNICKNDSIEFTIIDTVDVGEFYWDFGDGTSAANVSPVSHMYDFLPPSGQTLAKLTMLGPDSVCPVTAEMIIYIHEVRAQFETNNGLDSTACLGESILFTNTSLNANVYSWTLGDGTNSTSSTSINHTYVGVGTYEVTLMVESTTLGCKDTLVKEVIVFGNPVVSAIPDTVCQGDSLFLSVDSVIFGALYNWLPIAGVGSPNASSTYAYSDVNITYTVMVTDTNGCSANHDTDYVVIPTINGFIFDTLIVVGDTVVLQVDNWNGAVEFNWSPEEGLSCIDCSYPWVQPLEDITYSLFAGDVYGCSTADFTFNIQIIPDTHVDLPTTFTPNGDGINDKIGVKGWGVKELVYFEIYNRWGELIFATDDVNTEWDGTYKGVLQNNDIYVYKVKATTWLKEELDKEGHIHLMR